MRFLLLARILSIVAVGAAVFAPPVVAQPLEASQTESNLPDAPAPAAIFAPVGKPVDYTPRGESTELHNYLYEGFGPYPLIMSAVVAGYHQARHNPPDWREGWVGFSERYASDFGTSAINVSARYALAEAMDEDVYYYRCACTGVWPRLRHAMASVVVARNRITGRPAFALPGVVAPYAGPLVVVRTWYPGRYGLKDAFRMGNFGLLDYTIGNIGLEFLPSLAHTRAKSFVRRFHLENRHAAENTNAP